MRVSMDLPLGKAQTVTNEASTRNFKFTHEYLQLQEDLKQNKGHSTEAASSVDSQVGVPQVPQWVLGSSGPSQVKIEPKFQNRLADKDNAMQTSS